MNDGDHSLKCVGKDEVKQSFPLDAIPVGTNVTEKLTSGDDAHGEFFERPWVGEQSLELVGIQLLPLLGEFDKEPNLIWSICVEGYPGAGYARTQAIYKIRWEFDRLF